MNINQEHKRLILNSILFGAILLLALFAEQLAALERTTSANSQESKIVVASVATDSRKSNHRVGATEITSMTSVSKSINLIQQGNQEPPKPVHRVRPDQDLQTPPAAAAGTLATGQTIPPTIFSPTWRTILVVLHTSISTRPTMMVAERT